MDMTTESLLGRYVLVRSLAPSTVHKYEKYLSRFEDWLGRPANLSDLAEKVNEYLVACEVKYAPWTVADRTSFLRAILEFAAKRGWIEFPEVRTMKVRDTPPKALTMRELRKVFSWADNFQQAAIRLCYDTGLRRSDLFRITWSDVHEFAMKRPFKTPKRYFRVIVVQDKTGRLIERRIRAGTIELLRAIRSETDPRLLPWPYTPEAWDYRWRRLARLSHVDTHGVQDIRRTGASYCALHGLSAQDYLDHAGGSTSRKFYVDPRIASRPGPMPPTLRVKDKQESEDEPYEMQRDDTLNRVHPRLLAGEPE